MSTPTPTLIADYHRRLTWRVRLARKLRHVAYRLDPDATIVRRATIDWNDRVLWVTPGPCEVIENQMIGAGGSIRSAPEFTGNRKRLANSDDSDDSDDGRT